MKTSEDYSIDCDVWASYSQWTYVDAEVLVLGIDPHKIEGDLSFQFSEEQEDKKRRIRLILDGFRDRTRHRAAMPPQELIRRLKRLGHEFPTPLVAAVEDAQRSATPEQSEARESDVERKLKTARKVILAIAATQFGYRHGAHNPAASDIARVTQEAGLDVGDDTIRNLLNSTYSELDQEQKNHLKEVSSRKKPNSGN